MRPFACFVFVVQFDHMHEPRGAASSSSLSLCLCVLCGSAALREQPFVLLQPLSQPMPGCYYQEVTRETADARVLPHSHARPVLLYAFAIRFT